jgi:hypothetical protein
MVSREKVPRISTKFYNHFGYATAGRTGTGLSLRQNALDPGFHGVPAGPAHAEREADGADVS